MYKLSFDGRGVMKEILEGNWNQIKGKVKKQIVFMAFEQNPTVFNIGFGDVDENGNINDLVVTGNDDKQKILATVALAVSVFPTAATVTVARE